MKYPLCLLIGLLVTTVNVQSTPLLAEQVIKLDPNQSLPLGDKISLEVSSSNPTMLANKLSDWSSIVVEQLDEGRISITMDAESLFLGEPIKQYTDSSFVIDTGELSTQDFVSGFVQSVGDNKSFKLSELTSYVSNYIDDVTYIHGFNIASIVATQRSGDCTEYAVLLTALARSLGLPARVVIGTVILEETKHVSAFGHAWSEVWRDGQWHLLDAALYGSEARRHFYLPTSVLENEGPGYMMSLANGTMLMPKAITNLRSVSP